MSSSAAPEGIPLEGIPLDGVTLNKQGSRPPSSAAGRFDAHLRSESDWVLTPEFAAREASVRVDQAGTR